MDNWINRFRNATPVEGKEVLIPGHPERLLEAIRLKEGIPLLEVVKKDLRDVGLKLDVKFRW